MPGLNLRTQDPGEGNGKNSKFVHNFGFILVGESFRKNESIYALRWKMARNWKKKYDCVCVRESYEPPAPLPCGVQKFCEDRSHQQN